MNRSLLIKGILGLSLLLFFFLAGSMWDVVSVFQPDRIHKILGEFGTLAPVLFMIIMALAVIISPVPSVPLDIAAGTFFGPLLGTLYSAFGALGGAVVSFLIARFLGRQFIEQYLGGHINFCSKCSNLLLTKVIFVARLLPIFSFDIVSYGAGLTKISLMGFSVATLLGMLPLTFVYNYFGSILMVGRGFALILGLIMVFFFFVFPVIIERYDLFSMRRFFQHDDQGSASYK
jgi:uncharacterized membrane protein YdjX (TVP38/TMEM64 family)